MKEQNLIPPKLPDRLLGWFIKGDLLEEISGDLYEYYMELGWYSRLEKDTLLLVPFSQFLAPIRH